RISPPGHQACRIFMMCVFLSGHRDAARGLIPVSTIPLPQPMKKADSHNHQNDQSLCGAQMVPQTPVTWNRHARSIMRFIPSRSQMKPPTTIEKAIPRKTAPSNEPFCSWVSWKALPMSCRISPRTLKVKAEVTRAIQLARKRMRGFMQHSEDWRERVGKGSATVEPPHFDQWYHGCMRKSKKMSLVRKIAYRTHPDYGLHSV